VGDRTGDGRQGRKTAAQDRAARLGAALRANLHRRKEQDRSRAAASPQSPATMEPSRDEPGQRRED